MGFLESLKDSAATMFLSSDMAISFVNNYTQRYARVKSIKLDGNAITFTAIPNGSQESVTVTASDFTFADDNSSVSIGSLAADRPWVENALQDFAQGREFPIPEAGRGMVGQIKTLL